MYELVDLWALKIHLSTVTGISSPESAQLSAILRDPRRQRYWRISKPKDLIPACTCLETHQLGWNPLIRPEYLGNLIWTHPEWDGPTQVKVTMALTTEHSDVASLLEKQPFLEVTEGGQARHPLLAAYPEYST